MNQLQKAIHWLFQKAVGFPIWQGSTVDTPPGGWGSFSGYGDESIAMCLAVVYGCARVRAETMGSLPFHVYREDKSGTRVKAIDHPLYPILHDSPNAYQTSMEFRECMELSFCLWGNAYALKQRMGKRIVALNFLSPACTKPVWDQNGNLVYRYNDRLGKQYNYPPEDIVHVKNFSEDGIIGMTPLRRHVIEHAYEAQNYGRSFFRNSGRPGGILTSDQKAPASSEAGNALRNEWDKVFQGSENAGKTAVLWQGLKYQPVNLPPEDMQYIETRKLSATEIAGCIYGVPLNKLGLADKTATFASAEQFDVEYVKYRARPQAVRYEQAFNKALFAGEPGTYCEMDVDALLRGDAKTQAEYFASMVQNGNMTNDEVRRKLNLPELGGQSAKPHCQSNMIPVEDLGKLAAAASQTPGQAAGDIRKSADVPETGGFAMHVSKMEQTVLPNAPLRKIIRLRRDKDQRVIDAIVEESKIEA